MQKPSRPHVAKSCQWMHLSWRLCFFALALWLSGCGVLTSASNGETNDQDQVSATSAPIRAAFELQITVEDATIQAYLERHLELQRYRQLADLDTYELSRLLEEAYPNTQNLLATLGYFSPAIRLQLQATPLNEKAQHLITLEIELGEPTRISEVAISFSGAIAEQPVPAQSRQTQRKAIEARWSLPIGQTFSQDAWNDAKAAGLRQLAERRYPTASIQSSQADIDVEKGDAKLNVNYQSGPAFRFGKLQFEGLQRYQEQGAQRIARLPTQSEYSLNKLLETQQRLASSGYYDSVFLTLDTEAPDPQAATVIAQVREAPLKKLVLGVGASTDSGPRLSAEHTHNRLPIIGWRAITKAWFDNRNKSLGSEWTALPDEHNWRWVVSGLLLDETLGSYAVSSSRWRAGRSKIEDRVDRNYYLQYDQANSRGIDAPAKASSISMNYSWTNRQFNNLNAPTRGYGLAIEVGAGQALSNERAAYARSHVRWLQFFRLGQSAPAETEANIANTTIHTGSSARSSRIALRAELGAVVAPPQADIPVTQMFLAGGDTSVRGYGYQSIGARTENGSTIAGRYLAVASLEWQRPIIAKNMPSNLENTFFADVGSVADDSKDLHAKVGIGTGLRWRSPVGSVQGDFAYGVNAKRFRIHLRLGFSF